MVGKLLHVRVPLPRWGHYGHRECIAQPVAQSIYENLVLVKGGSVGFLQVESQGGFAPNYLLLKEMSSSHSTRLPCASAREAIAGSLHLDVGSATGGTGF